MQNLVSGEHLLKKRADMLFLHCLLHVFLLQNDFALVNNPMPVCGLCLQFAVPSCLVCGWTFFLPNVCHLGSLRKTCKNER